MKRRKLLGTLAAAGLAGLLPLAGSEPGQPHLPFNLSGLHPAEFKRRWVSMVRRRRALGLPADNVWRFEPTGAIEPFMDWYPGDEWVDRWALRTTRVHSDNHVMARSFVAEARRRGKPLDTNV